MIHFSKNESQNRNNVEFIMTHISEDDILKIIQSLPNKGTGPASIPLNLLKIVANIIVVPLCHIINVSFSKMRVAVCSRYFKNTV